MVEVKYSFQCASGPFVLRSSFQCKLGEGEAWESSSFAVSMGIFRKFFMMTTQHGVHDQTGKNSGIPAIPVDIGFQSGKQPVKGAKESGIISQAVGNPGVILGMGLTTVALLGMFKKSFMGDKAGAQRYMQYRIAAQFFTVCALVAGVTLFGATYESHEEKENRLIAERQAANMASA